MENDNDNLNNEKKDDELNEKEINIRKYLFNAYEMAINGIPAKILMEINKKVMFLLFTKFEQEATVKLANPEPLSMFPAEFIQGKFL